MFYESILEAIADFMEQKLEMAYLTCFVYEPKQWCFQLGNGPCSIFAFVFKMNHLNEFLKDKAFKRTLKVFLHFSANNKHLITIDLCLKSVIKPQVVFTAYCWFSVSHHSK